MQFAFENGVLGLRCDDDTDEIVATVAKDAGRWPGGETVFVGLTGTRMEYAWSLTNHRGYLDAFQLRLFDDARHLTSLQFEVAASAIDCFSVNALDPTG